MPLTNLPYQEKTVVDFPYSGDYRIDVLLDEPKYRWTANKAIQISFPDPAHLSAGESAFSSEQVSAAKEILAKLAQMLNVRFDEVSSGELSAGIRFVNAFSLPYAGETVGSPGETVTVRFNPNDKAHVDGIAVGTSGWATLVHEIGHALGLKHPGNYNGSQMGGAAKGNFLASSEDLPVNTVMTYAPDGQDLQRDFFGKYDLLALRYLFGLKAYNTNDDVYVVDDSTGKSFSILVDEGGTDTLDFSNLSVGATIDLRSGRESSVGLRSDGEPTVGNFTLNYGAVIEQVFGSQFDDLIFFSKGLQNLDAGTGFDKMVFDGRRENFQVKSLEDKPGNRSVELTTSDKQEVPSIVRSVELLKFSDYTVDLTISDVVNEVGVNAMNAIAEIYVAYFNRVPDAEGLHYWLKEYGAGKTLEEIGRTFYAVASNPMFKELTGYSENMSDESFVRIIYKNVLGRNEVDAEGLAYWTNALSKVSGTPGAESRGTLIKTILASAHSFKGDSKYGWVADLLDNKLQVAKYFAFEQGLTLTTPELTYAKCAEICNAVTAVDTSAAIGLIGIHDAPLNIIS